MFISFLSLWIWYTAWYKLHLLSYNRWAPSKSIDIFLTNFLCGAYDVYGYLPKMQTGGANGMTEKKDIQEQESEEVSSTEALDVNGIMNLAGSILAKDDDTIDLNGMMMMAANLLKEDGLLGNLGFAQAADSLTDDDQQNSEMEWLSRQLQELTHQNSELKEELVSIKEQISEAKEAIAQLVEASKKRWWQLK